MKCPSCKEPLKEVIKNSDNRRRYFLVLECELCKKKFNSNYDLFVPFIGAGLIGGYLIDLLAGFTGSEFLENYLGWIFLILLTVLFFYIISNPNEIK